MKAIICIDASNYHYYLKSKKWRIDWEKFKAYFKRSYILDEIYYYEGIPSKGFYFDTHPNPSIDDFNDAKKIKKKYLQSLKKIGFKVRSKPIGRVYDNTEGKFKHKCNFDVELTIDALDSIDKFEAFLLCSGDGDFTKLIKYLKGKWKKTIVIAPSDRLSHDLEKAANKVIYLENIKEDIEQT